MAKPKASVDAIAEAKKEAGVSGVGLRKDRLVVYLAVDDPAVRGKAEEAARQLGVTAPLVFEVTGELRNR